MSDLTNHRRTLKYHDPWHILRKLRRLEVELADVQLDTKVRKLRMPTLNKYREWRDAALFTYGMRVLQSYRIVFATEAARDYDFVTAWRGKGESFYCPVQLKELVPADLNPDANLEQLLKGLAKYSGPSDTVLAVRLNRAGALDLASASFPPVPFKQDMVFLGSAPNSARWCLYGNALGTPVQVEFEYPT